MDSQEPRPTEPLATMDPAPLPTPGRPAQYEFGPNEDEAFRRLAFKMSFVGLFTLAVGLLVIGTGVYLHHAGSILSGALYALIGIWTHRASVSFRNIAETRGKDVSHLILAISDLGKLYSLQFWLCIAALFAAFVGIGLLYS